MYQFKESFWGMILLMAGAALFLCPPASAQGNLDFSLFSSPLLNPDPIPFAPAVNYAAGDRPYSVFCADLDGDSDLDMAVTNATSDNVSILRNNGDGTFQPKVDYATGDWPYSVFCADLDGDSDLDLAVANFSANTVSILKSNGDGTFQTKVDYGTGSDPTSVFCA
ncbi:MAG: FG-GAP-like repeat-containing protein, partial [Candidatus Zixiibacteriota bacterium]